MPDVVDRRLVVDAGLLSLLAWVLVGIRVLLPSGLRAQLAFDHGAFIPWTLWTHAYVHDGWAHLLQNVGGFVAIAGVAYILCRVLNARRWFWVSTVAFLTVLPVLVSLSSYVLLGWFAPAGRGRGFEHDHKSAGLLTQFARKVVLCRFSGLLEQFDWVAGDRYAPYILSVSYQIVLSSPC